MKQEDIPIKRLNWLGNENMELFVTANKLRGPEPTILRRWCKRNHAYMRRVDVGDVRLTAIIMPQFVYNDIMYNLFTLPITKLNYALDYGIRELHMAVFPIVSAYVVSHMPATHTVSHEDGRTLVIESLV